MMDFREYKNYTQRALDSVDEADLDLPDSRSALQKLRRALQPVTPAG